MSDHRDRAITRRGAIRLLVACCTAIPAVEAQQKLARDFCWGKDNAGKEIYVPCGEPRAIPEPTWAVVDLDNLAGIEVSKYGKSVKLPADEIWSALAGP